jgi:predicted ribonuclease YlaK
MVTAHFVLKGTTADQEMISCIQRMKKSARSVTLVTSDGRIRIEAQAAQAKLLRSEEFASLVMDAVVESEISGATNIPPVSGDEVNEWLRLFGREDELD